MKDEMKAMLALVYPPPPAVAELGLVWPHTKHS